MPCGWAAAVPPVTRPTWWMPTSSTCQRRGTEVPAAVTRMTGPVRVTVKAGGSSRGSAAGIRAVRLAPSASW